MLALALAITTLTLTITAALITRTRTHADGPYLVHRVIDGDTIIITRPHQHRGRYTRKNHQTRVRLLNIDTPESVKPNTPIEPGALQASALLKRFLPPGTPVYLKYGIETRDKYHRTLAAVYTHHPNGTHRIHGHPAIELGEQMILHGYARAISIGPNVRGAARARAAQHTAERARAGLWAGAWRSGQNASRDSTCRNPHDPRIMTADSSSNPARRKAHHAEEPEGLHPHRAAHRDRDHRHPRGGADPEPARCPP